MVKVLCCRRLQNFVRFVRATFQYVGALYLFLHILS